MEGHYIYTAYALGNYVLRISIQEEEEEEELDIGSFKGCLLVTDPPVSSSKF